MSLLPLTSLSKRHQLEWLALAGVFAVTGALSVVFHNADMQRALDSEQGRLDALAHLLESDVATSLDAMNRALNGVQREHPKLFDPAEHMSVQRQLRVLTDAMPGMRGVTTIDVNGVVSAAYPVDLVGRSFATRGYFTEPRAHPNAQTLYLSPPFLSVRGDVVVSATRMVARADGSFGGIVSAVLDPRYFGGRIRSAAYAPDVRAYLGHSTGGVFLQVATPAYDAQRDRQGFAWPFFTRTPLAPLEAKRTVRPSNSPSDSALVVAISRDPYAVLAVLSRQGSAFAVFFAALCVASSLALALLQLRRGRVRRELALREQERMQSDALRASEARFRTLIEESPVAIAILRQGRFLYTNRRYNLLHGYAENEELHGLQWRAMIAPHSLAGLNEQEGLISTDSPIELRFEALDLGNSGELLPVFMSTTRVELSDGPVTLVFVQDIAAQKRAEAFLLEARDAAEAANQSKAEFLANMSHEIRTPLNAILGLAYLLEQSHLGHDANAMLSKIRSSGRSLLGIINDVLDVSKIDAGAMMVETTWLRLQDVLDSVAATMGVAVGDKPIQLMVHPLPPGLTSIRGDALRLEQLLVNLTSNAIKFTMQGHVELSVHAERGADDVRMLRFCVADTGIGIAPELQDAVFSPFTQADSSTTRRFGGSGLGLTICKKMVELMGGEIGVTSTLGVGSTFWFSVPLHGIAEPEYSSPEMVRLDAIIACNHVDSLANVTATARGLGWQVCPVATAQDALMELTRRVDTVLPGVIVLDWQRNGNDCMTVARAIRQLVPADKCPVVVMASTALATALHRGPGDGVIDALLTKPVTASTLYNAAIAARRRRANAGLPETVRKSGAAELAGVHVLVVDDSEINRDVAQRILQEKGARVTLAEDGKRAIAWLLAQPDEVDLILMDVQMPVLDGIEATRQLRAMPRFAELPIVALTAGAFRSQHEDARAAGMTHFITKPFDIPLTIDLIQRLTGKYGADPAALAPAPAAAPPAGTQGALELARGLDIWGDLDTYRVYLRKFCASFADSPAQIAASVAGGERRAGAALAHKLAGAAANVALREVSRLAMELERQLAGTDAVEALLDQLNLAMTAALADIAELAPQPIAAPAAPAALPSAAVLQDDVAPLLQRLLAALHTDTPGPSAPVLAQLAGHLPSERVAGIAALVDEFDFRAAERMTRALASELSLSLDEAA